MKWSSIIILLIYIASVSAIPIDLNKEEITIHKEVSEISFQYLGYPYKIFLKVEPSQVRFYFKTLEFTLTPQNSQQIDLDEDTTKDIEVYITKLYKEKAYIKIILLEQLEEKETPPVTPPEEDEAPDPTENIQGVMQGISYATTAVQLASGQKTLTGVGFSLALSEGIKKLQETRPKAATALSVIQALDGLNDASSSPRNKQSTPTGSLILDPDQLKQTIFILNDETGELGISGYGTNELNVLCNKRSHIRNTEIYKNIQDDKIKIVFADKSSKLRLENNNIQNLLPGSYVDLDKHCEITGLVARATQDISIKIRNLDFTLKQSGKLAYEQKGEYESVSLSEGFFKILPKTIKIGSFKAISKNPKLDLSVLNKQEPNSQKITSKNKDIFTSLNIPLFKTKQTLIQENPNFVSLDNVILFPKKQLNLFLENYDTTFPSNNGQITLQNREDKITYNSPKNKVIIRKNPKINLK